MATFTAEIQTTRTAEENRRIITGYLASKGYAPKGESGRTEWRKGVYWVKYVTFATAEGKASVRAWINLPYPGMGSYIKYYLGRTELKSMVAELEVALLAEGELPTYAAAASSADLTNADAVSQAESDSRPRPAAFASRAAALLVDVVAVQLLTIPLVTLLVLLARSGGPQAHSRADVTGAVLLIAFWYYFAKLESSPRQSTWGKRLLGIKVCDLEGRRISIGRASGRFFARMLSALLYGIGFLIAPFTPRKQALHDLLCGTLVVGK